MYLSQIIDEINDIAETLNKIGDAEGVNLCKQLNSHIFDVLYTKKVEDTNATTVK